MIVDKEQYCDRCGIESTRLYSVTQDDEFGDLITKMICWDCDFDVMNGGDLFDDIWNILLERAENLHEYDPINNPSLCDLKNGF